LNAGVTGTAAAEGGSMSLDHVVFATSAPEDVAQRLRDEIGLRVTASGTIRGTGWGSRTIPLGAGQYLELASPSDTTFPAAAGLASLLAGGDTWLAWAMASDDVPGLAATLGLPASPGTLDLGHAVVRWTGLTPDPAWRTHGVVPFFVQLADDVDRSPLEPVREGPGLAGIAHLELSAPPSATDELSALVGAVPAEVRLADGAYAMRAVHIRVEGEVVELPLGRGRS
jgi:hypothetical protein